MPSATAMPASASCSVLANRAATWPSTGCRLTSDRPRSPVAARRSHCAYCTSTGRWRPSWSRTRSMSAPEAPTPAITSAGSPGLRGIRRNAAKDAPSATGTSATSRRITKRATVASRRLRLLHPGSPQVDGLERKNHDALDRLAHPHHLGVDEQRNPRRIRHDRLLQLAVDLEPLARLGRPVTLRDQLVDARILVEHGVPAGRRPLTAREYGARHVARLAGHGLPAEEVQLVVVLGLRLSPQGAGARPLPATAPC